MVSHIQYNNNNVLLLAQSSNNQTQACPTYAIYIYISYIYTYPVLYIQIEKVVHRNLVDEITFKQKSAKGLLFIYTEHIYSNPG